MVHQQVDRLEGENLTCRMGESFIEFEGHPEIRRWAPRSSGPMDAL